MATVGLALCIDNKDYVRGHISGSVTVGQYMGYHRSQARNVVAEFAIFCLLTGVSACRIAVGNDYWVYRDNFKLIAQNRHVSSEFGFNYIVKWIQQICGYDKYLPVFAFFSVLTVFFLVKALHDQAGNFAFSLFLIMAGGYYFNSLNSVRYYLALAVALYSMKYVLRGEYLKFVLWIAAGAVFHKTILLVIPVYLTARYLAGVRLKIWHFCVGAILVLSLIFGKDIYRALLFKIYPYYENSAFDNGQLSFVNIAKCLCVMVLCFLCYRSSIRDNLVNRFYFFLNLAGLIAFCCGSFVPEVSRVGHYMIVSQVFLIPGVLMDMKEGWFKKLCYVGVVGAFFLYFIMLLKGMYAVDVRLLPYLNWIFN